MKAKHIGRVVRINGNRGIVIGHDPKKHSSYQVRFENPNYFKMTDWWFHEDEIVKALSPHYKKFGPECECGWDKLPELNKTPYSHAQWCVKYKRKGDTK